MRKRKYKKREKVIIRLTKKDKQYLIDFLNNGEGKARSFKRARVLLKLDEGLSTTVIGKDVNYYPMTIREIGKRYIEGGIESALYDKPRPGQKRALTEKQANEIIAMVCSPAPEGRSRWAIRLIAEEAKNQKIVDNIGRETIRILLKTHDLKPWREKNVVRS
jgi:putative transposase